jgi:RimJ/RimL family protein N-acetyltransferase
VAIAGSLLSPHHVRHLQTERLVLRRFTAEDDELLVDLDADPEVVRYLRPHFETTLEKVRTEILPRLLGYYDTLVEGGAWAAHERTTGVFIGWFFVRPDRSPPHDLELGYRLRRAAWGKGYATEMSRALLRHGFARLGYSRVMARAELENAGSWRVMEKLGMTREREVDEDGIRVVEYGIDRAGWVVRSGI